MTSSSSNPFSPSTLSNGSPSPPSIRYLPSSQSSRGTLLLLENRPSEGGRGVITRLDGQDEGKFDLVGKDRRVGSRVHEYGGGAWEIIKRRDGSVKVLWSEMKDGNVFVSSLDGKESKVTIDQPSSRFADFHPHSNGTQILAVHEEHATYTHMVTNTLVLISLQSKPTLPKTIVSGNDFYSSPRFSPDGQHVAFITWNIPDMPFESCELWIGRFNDKVETIDKLKHVAGKSGGQELVDQPIWIDEKRLAFVCDRTGWKQFYIYNLESQEMYPVLKEPSKIDFTGPSWRLGRKEWTILNDPIRLIGFQNGKLYVHDVESQQVEEIELEGTAWIEEIHKHPQDENSIVYVSLNERSPPSVNIFNLLTRKISKIYQTAPSPDPSIVSTPKLLSFPTSPTSLHDPSPTTAYARFFPPVPSVPNPPCLISVHGGPTGTSKFWYNPIDVQFFTSNGIAVCQVEYGGTVGFGRSYRKRLDEGWGVVDVSDAEHAAKYLIEKGLVNGEKIGITGASSGGLTALLSLCKSEIWKAGISHYGISDLSLLLNDTHKFESGYLSIFPPAGSKRDKAIKERSPINYIEDIKAPILLLQGLDDKVVPPNQAQVMKEKLEEKGGKVKLVLFEGEGHGWRKKETLEKALEEQLEFLKGVWKL